MDDFLNYSSANQAIANQARARHEAVTSSLLLPDNGIDLRAIVGILHPAEIRHGRHSAADPPALIAALPLVVVIAVNLAMSLVVRPRIDSSYLAEERWGGTSISAVAGMDAGAKCVGTAGSQCREPGWVWRGHRLAAGFCGGAGLGAGDRGRSLVSVAVATNVLAALTGSASGGLTVALDALGHNYMAIASQAGINPALMHRVALIGAGTLDTLPHNGAVVTLLTLCRSSHRESYFDICHGRHRQPRARLDRGHHARHGVWVVLKSALWSGREVVNVFCDKFGTPRRHHR
jgi:hypothetical protein